MESARKKRGVPSREEGVKHLDAVSAAGEAFFLTIFCINLFYYAGIMHLSYGLLILAALRTAGALDGQCAATRTHKLTNFNININITTDCHYSWFLPDGTVMADTDDPHSGTIVSSSPTFLAMSECKNNACVRIHCPQHEAPLKHDFCCSTNCSAPAPVPQANVTAAPFLDEANLTSSVKVNGTADPGLVGKVIGPIVAVVAAGVVLAVVLVIRRKKRIRKRKKEAKLPQSDVRRTSLLAVEAADSECCTSEL